MSEVTSRIIAWTSAFLLHCFILYLWISVAISGFSFPILNMVGITQIALQVYFTKKTFDKNKSVDDALVYAVLPLLMVALFMILLAVLGMALSDEPLFIAAFVIYILSLIVIFIKIGKTS